MTHEDINFELACVLYNIGGLHSHLGALESRVSPEGMKVACTHFQCAAWAFQHLKDAYSAEKFSQDFDKILLTFYYQLMMVIKICYDTELNTKILFNFSAATITATYPARFA